MAARRRGAAPGESSAVNVSALAGGAAAARRGPQPPKDDFDEFMQLRLFAPCPSCGGPHAASLPRTQPNPRASGGESERARGVSIPRARARAAPLRPPREVARLQAAADARVVGRARAQAGGGEDTCGVGAQGALDACDYAARRAQAVQQSCALGGVPGKRDSVSTLGGPGTYCRGFTSVCWENGSL